jgi:DtxR family Mn-dependent transcriptional regulator
MYLVMVALLRNDSKQPVPLSLLANKLSVSPVSANEMCRKLVERGLVRYQPYKGVTLTETGEVDAQVVLSRRRLWVVFLVDNLGIEPDEADAIACQLEHITSDKLVDALKAFVEGNIPHANAGKVHGSSNGASADEISSAPQQLSACAAGLRGQVMALGSDSAARDFLQAQGVGPGATVEVLAVGADGTLLLSAAEKHVALARSVAAHVEVVPMVAGATPGMARRACTWEKCSTFWACMHGEVVRPCDVHVFSN